MKKLSIFIIAIFSLGTAFISQTKPMVAATTITVNTLNDNVVTDGLCTLREAINNANTNSDTTGGDCTTGTPIGSDTISIPLTGTLLLNSPLPPTYTNILIWGSSQTNLILDGNNLSRIFTVNSALFGLYQLTVRNTHTTSAQGGNGGAVYVKNGGGSFFADTVTFTNNRADGSGGAIYAEGNSSVLISRSIFSDNIAFLAGGAIAGLFGTTGDSIFIDSSTFVNNTSLTSVGGAIYTQKKANTIGDSTFESNVADFGGAIGNSSDDFHIINSTFSGNTANSFGGAIDNFGKAEIVFSTFIGNNSPFYGGAVMNHNGLPGPFVNNPTSSVNFINSIIANSGGGSENCSGTITDSGNNLQFGGVTGFSCGASITQADPLVGPLQNNGGLTKTHSLLPGSPAIDAGKFWSAYNNDQRGVVRPQGSDYDIGAFELEGVVIASPSPSTSPSPSPSASPTPTPTLPPGDIVCHTSFGSNNVSINVIDQQIPNTLLVDFRETYSVAPSIVNMGQEIGRQTIWGPNANLPTSVTLLEASPIGNGTIHEVIQEPISGDIRKVQTTSWENSPQAGTYRTLWELHYDPNVTLKNTFTYGNNFGVQCPPSNQVIPTPSPSPAVKVNFANVVIPPTAYLDTPFTVTFTVVNNTPDTLTSHAVQFYPGGRFPLFDNIFIKYVSYSGIFSTGETVSGTDFGYDIYHFGFNVSTPLLPGESVSYTVTLKSQAGYTVVGDISNLGLVVGGVNQNGSLPLNQGDSVQGAITFIGQTATPTPSASPSPSDSPSPTPSATPDPTPGDSPTPSPSPSPSPSVDPSPSPSPVASGVVISPASITMGLSCPVVPMTATLVDTNGQPIISGITSVDWGMSSTNSIGTFTNINGLTADFKALNLGTGNIYVTIWYNGQSYVGSIPVEVNNLTNCPLPIPTPSPSPSVDPSPSVSPTPSDNGNNNSNSDSTNHNSAGEAPKCTDQKPGSAPVLNGASVTGDNEVTLYWSKANDPVTYYLITYGNKPGEQAYGNPNVGNKNTTQYTVKNLSGGQTYYFKVRSGNGCQPGEFSNELAATPGGGQVSGPASGFAAGVLGETTEEEASPTPTPSQEATNSASMTPSITPEVQGVTGTCADPWWKWLFLLVNIVLQAIALFIALKHPEDWKKLGLPTLGVSALLIILFFCNKLLWLFIVSGVSLISWGVKSWGFHQQENI